MSKGEADGSAGDVTGAAQGEVSLTKGRSAGKGRATPKRSEAQKRRAVIDAPPTNRREAARQMRVKQAEDRDRIRRGTKAGDEKAFLPRDRGPIRGFVRDTVDAERTIAPLILPVMLAFVASNFFLNMSQQAGVFPILVIFLIFVAFDLFRLARVLNKGLVETFPDATKKRGHIAYGLQRVSLIRKWRTPPVRVPVKPRRRS